MNKTIKCVFCNYEKGHTIETCSYARLRANELYKELIFLITNRAPLKYDEYEERLYVLDLIERYISKRDVDALILFHYSELYKYIQEYKNEYFENERLLYTYFRKTYLLSCFYYDNVFDGKFKLEKEDDFPKKSFQLKTRIILEMNANDTFDCPICLSTVENDLCIIYDKCNHKVCSDCFYEMTKTRQKSNIKIMKCCLCRNTVDTILFLDEITQHNVLSKYIPVNTKE